MNIVESRDKRYRATVREVNEGVEIALYDRGRSCTRGTGTLMRMSIIDAPFHVVRDAAVDMVRSLKDHPSCQK